MLEYVVHTGDDIAPVLPDVARLRIEVFREWPWLYDGEQAQEEKALAGYCACDSSIVVTARADGNVVGAATGLRMDHADKGYSEAFALTELPQDQTFYLAESVLLPEHRGQGAGHAFFALRERHALALGLRWAVFCSVIRPDDHPLKPEGARSLDRFWLGRGYRPLLGVSAEFRWKDIDDRARSPKPMQFWIRDLGAG
ncbi:MAG: GNAT family N-acetyltransferase [Rubellimicrobium sp.]|nr:GNAT family N-acetyltransferase [Rubellimicrobium sp.]